jgi:uncharacterized protein YdeI (YjbR/CyaY-like superfamily)
MAKRKTLFVIGREEWRAWLEENHDTQTEVWLVFHKRHTGRPSIPYEDAVEEALCFGWIDSLIRRLDDERYARKFTRRTNAARWSPSNRRRVARLIREGRMTPAGMTKVGFDLVGADGAGREAGRDRQGPRRQARLTPKMERALRANRKAWENYRKLAPSYRRNCIGWVMSAKREETRERRFREVLGVLTRGERLGMK